MKTFTCRLSALFVCTGCLLSGTTAMAAISYSYENDNKTLVATVTGDDGSDFYLLKDFIWCDAVSASGTKDFDKVELGKYGPGTLEASGKHQLQTGYKINIYGGAWKLGASHITDDAAQGFRLCGGTLEAADGTENSCGSLSVSHPRGFVLGVH